MLTINLLPPEFKRTVKSSTQPNIKKTAVIAACIFAVVTVVLYADYWFSKSKFSRLNHDWSFMKPQSTRLTALEQEVEKTLMPENLFLNRFVTADKSLTQMLMWSSEFLSPTSWLTQMKMERIGEGAKLYIEGMTLPSKDKSSIECIEEYLHHLKEKMPDAVLSLTTRRQNVKEVEVMQFMATFDWAAPALEAKSDSDSKSKNSKKGKKKRSAKKK